MKTKTFSDLELAASYHYSRFMDTMEFVRRTYPCEDSERYEYDDETKTIRRVRLSDMEWLPYEEPNDPF